MSIFLKTHAPLLSVCTALLFGFAAHGQYANKSLGISAGYTKFSLQGESLEYRVPLALDGSLYIENGFEAVIHFPVMLLKENDRGLIRGKQFIGLSPSVGVRYVFLEEAFRPYAGLDLSFLFFFGNVDLGSLYVGPSPSVGFDYFLTEGVSLGMKAQFNWYLSLNKPPENSLGFTAGVNLWF